MSISAECQKEGDLGDKSLGLIAGKVGLIDARENVHLNPWLKEWTIWWWIKESYTGSVSSCDWVDILVAEKP